jgi:hypothetical protein
MVNGVGNPYGEYAAQTLQKGGEISLSRPNPNKMGKVLGAVGDTVEISEEARALLRAKMKEMGTPPGDLTKEQKDELKGVLSKALGVSKEQLDEVAHSLGRGDLPPEGMRRPPKGGPPPQGGRSGGAGAGRGAGGEARSTGVENRIEKLEEDIKELEKEIEELRSKASRDEGAKKELKTKEVELSSKQTELAELQGQQNKA